MAYYYLGAYQRAIQDFDKAIRLESGYALAYDARGLAYSNLGQYSKTDADKAKACSLDNEYC